MSLLSNNTNDILGKVITIGDKYTVTLLRVNCPIYYDFCPANELDKVFPFRGIDFQNSVPGINAIEEQIEKEILEASITKVWYTTRRYAHIKSCIKKHINFDAYHCVWETNYGWGYRVGEPKTIHVVCKHKYRGKWRDLIRVSITLIENHDIPF